MFSLSEISKKVCFYEQADPVSEFLVRYEAQTSNDRISFHLSKYPILRRTPKGVWIRFGYESHRFVLNGAHKRFAYPTREEAWTSFLRRKTRQVAILSGQLNAARLILTEAEKGRPS